MTTMTDTVNYAWVIDKDHLFDDEHDDGMDNEAGTTGPRNAPQALLERLNAGEGVSFQMHDDDNELYYDGRIIALNDDGSDQAFANCGDEFFGPLTDFGTPNAGAVSIRYQSRRSTGHVEWVEL